MTTMTAPRRSVNRKAARPAHGVARLILQINGVAYSLHPLWCDGVHATRLYRLRKRGTPTRYVVAETPEGPVCDCPDATFHRDGRDPEDFCKHVKAMRAVGLITMK